MKKILLVLFMLLIGFNVSASNNKKMSLDSIYKLSSSELFTLIQESGIDKNIFNEFVKVHGGEEKASVFLHSNFKTFINEGHAISYTVHSDMVSELQKVVEKITN